MIFGNQTGITTKTIWPKKSKSCNYLVSKDRVKVTFGIRINMTATRIIKFVKDLSNSTNQGEYITTRSVIEEWGVIVGN